MTYEQELHVNPLPGPTWNWLRVNDTAIKVAEDAFEAVTVVELPGGISDSAPLEEEDVERLISAESGMGEEFARWIAECPVDPLTLTTTVGMQPEKPGVLKIYAPEEEMTVGRFQVVARKGSEMTLVMYINGEQKASSLALETRLLIEEGAKVHLVQVCDTGADTACYSDIAAKLAKDSEFTLLQITLGRKDTFFGVCADLLGDRSRMAIDSAYTAGQDQKVDINYVARHRGKNTESEIKVNGVLRAGAKKTFRGTIDFIRGSAGAKGDEREDVLLLDEDVENKTVPLILCQEEDVEGSHGASIGDLSEDALLYFRSRGIPDEVTYELMASGRLIAAIRGIPDDTLKQELLTRYGEEDEKTED